jgi:hypothetical protein
VSGDFESISDDFSPPTKHRLVSEIDQNPVKTERSCQDFSMQDYIESQNIAIFKQRLETETDAAKQEILRQLLADEIAKYAARIEAKPQKEL